MKYIMILLAVFALAWATSSSLGQEEQEPTNRQEEQEPANGDKVRQQARKLVEDAQDRVEVLATEVNEAEEAHEASAGILRPIYELAETFAFPAFHWVAFALMVTGVVSFALQLVLAKLVVLSKLGFSLTEILSDALGLVISLIGLVLTTQAATENSTFTTSPFAVISATGAGILVGFIFYLWGQSQEVQALKGRRADAVARNKTA